MASPLLTIIIPTLNSEATLQVALDSVLHQDFKDLEVLVIDSLSVDDTLNIVKRTAGNDDRVRFVSEPDKGIYDAMNKGIALARGEWIYFLGSDDRLYNDKVVSDLSPDLNSGDYDFVYGNIVTDKNKRMKYYGEFTPEKLLKKNISHQAIFTRRAVFEWVGGFNQSYRAYADWDWTLRCFADPRVRTRYRDLIIAEFRSGGTSSSYDLRFLREVMFPKKLKALEQGDTNYLRHIANYDEWWRFFRNARIRDLGGIREFLGGEAVPASLESMVRWQQKMPSSLLRAGGISKLFMLASFINNILLRRI